MSSQDCKAPIQYFTDILLIYIHFEKLTSQCGRMSRIARFLQFSTSDSDQDFNNLMHYSKYDSDTSYQNRDGDLFRARLDMPRARAPIRTFVYTQKEHVCFESQPKQRMKMSRILIF